MALVEAQTRDPERLVRPVHHVHRLRIVGGGVEAEPERLLRADEDRIEQIRLRELGADLAKLGEPLRLHGEVERQVAKPARGEVVDVAAGRLESEERKEHGKGVRRDLAG